MYMVQHVSVNEENWIPLLYGPTLRRYLTKKIGFPYYMVQHYAVT